MNHLPSRASRVLPVLVLLAGCASVPSGPHVRPQPPETLTVRDDGSMWLRDRPIPERDVIIYPDGTGGEKAAVRVRMEPLHPDFFRDTIVVERE